MTLLSFHLFYFRNMLEIVPDIAQSTHGNRNIFADIRNVPTSVPCAQYVILQLQLQKVVE